MEQQSLTNSSEIKTAEKKKDKPSTLIMKGGGIKGLAYVGALEVLTSNGYTFNWFAGTSAGAISAVLMGVGFSYNELEIELGKKNFNDFKDSNLFGMIWNLITKCGLYQANSFTIWLDTLVANKLQTRNRVLFSTLKTKNINTRITIYASRRGTKVHVFDSKELKELSDRQSPPIAFAARCSMAIPFFFTPTSIHGYKTYDGGMQNNYPVNALLADNPNTRFVGLYLGPEVYEPDQPTSLLRDLLSILTEANDEDALRVHEEDTIIIDPRPISTLDFTLTIEEKEFLLEGGRLSALKFLNRKKEIELPADYKERKEKHEIVRKEIEKNRKRTKKKRRIKQLIALAIVIFVAFGLNSIKYSIYNLFPSYRTSQAETIGFEGTFLIPKDSSFHHTAYDLVNNPAFFSEYGEPCDFIQEHFNPISVKSSTIIKRVCTSKEQLKIIFHISENDIKYAGFVFKIKKLNLDDAIANSNTWRPYNCDIKASTSNEFLFREPNKEGDYEFTVKILNK